MLKQYIWKGTQWQFEEGEQPAGAVELKAAQQSAKAEKPANKVAKPANKSAAVKTK